MSDQELDDLMGDDFDLGEFDLDLQASGKEPITAANVTKRTVEEATKISGERIDRYIRNALPEHVRRDVEKIESVANTAIDTFDKNTTEVKRHIDQGVKSIKQLFPSLGDVIDKIWTTADDERRRDRESDEERLERMANAEVIESIGDLARAQELSTEINNAMEDKRNKSVVEVLKAINKDTAYSRAYDSEITSKFQNKLLQVQIKSLLTLGDMRRENHDFAQLSLDRLSAIVENTSLPDVMKARKLLPMLKSEFSAHVRKNLTDNLYNSDVAKKMRDKTKAVVNNVFDMPKMWLEQFAQGLEMAASTKEQMEEAGISKNELIASSGVEYADKKLAKRLGESIGKNPFVAKAFNAVTDFVQDPKVAIMRLQEKVGDDNVATRTLSALLESLGDILHTKDSEKTAELAKEDLNTPDQLDIRTKLSINQAIPGFLAKIHSEVRAQRLGDTNPDVSRHELVFDYRSYTFKTKGGKGMNMARAIYGDVSRFKKTTARRLDYDLYKKLEVSDEELSKKDKAKLSEYFTGKAMNYGLNVANLERLDIDELAEELGVDRDGLHIFFNKFKDHVEDGKNRSEMNNVFNRITKSTPGLHRHIEDAMENGNHEQLVKMGILSMDRDGELQYNSDFMQYMMMSRKDRQDYKKTGQLRQSTMFDIDPETKHTFDKIVSEKGLKEDLKDLGNEVKDLAKKGMDKATEKHNELMENNKLYRGAVNTANKVGGKALDKAKDLGGKALSRAEDLGLTGINKGLEQYAKLSNKMGKNKHFKKLKRLANQGLIKASDFVDENLGDLKETEIYRDAVRAGKKAKIKAKKLRKAGKQALLDNLDPELKEAIEETYTDLKDKALDKYNEVKGNLEENEHVKKYRKKGKALERLGKRKYKSGKKLAESAKDILKTKLEANKANSELAKDKALNEAIDQFVEELNKQHTDKAESEPVKKKRGRPKKKKEKDIGDVAKELASEGKVLEAINSAKEAGNVEVIDTIVTKLQGTSLASSEAIREAASEAKAQIASTKKIGDAAMEAAAKDEDKWNGMFNMFRLSKIGYGILPFRVATKFSLKTLAEIIKKGHALDWKVTKGLAMGALKGGLGLATGLGKGLMSGSAGVAGIGKGLGKGALNLFTGGKYGKGWGGDLYDGMVDLSGLAVHPLADTVTGFGSGFKQGWNSKLRSPFQFMAHQYGKYKKLWNGGDTLPEDGGTLAEQGFVNPDDDGTPNLPSQPEHQLPTEAKGKSVTAKLGGLYSKGKGKLLNMLGKKEQDEAKRTEELAALATMANEAMILNAGSEVQEQILKNEDAPSTSKVRSSKLYRKMRAWMRRKKKGKEEGGSWLSKLFALGGGGLAALMSKGIGGFLLEGVKGAIGWMFKGIGSIAFKMTKWIFGKMWGVLGKLLSGAASMMGLPGFGGGGKDPKGKKGKKAKAAKKPRVGRFGKFAMLGGLGLGAASMFGGGSDDSSMDMTGVDTATNAMEHKQAMTPDEAKKEKKLDKAKKDAKELKKGATDAKPDKGGSKKPKIDPKTGKPDIKQDKGLAKKLEKALVSGKDKVADAIKKKVGPKAGAKIAAKFAFKAGLRLVPYLGWGLLLFDTIQVGYYMFNGHSLLGAVAKAYIGFDPFKDDVDEVPVDENGNVIKPDAADGVVDPEQAKEAAKASGVETTIENGNVLTIGGNAETVNEEGKTVRIEEQTGTVSDQIKQKEKQEAQAAAAKSAIDAKGQAKSMSNDVSAFMEILKANNAVNQEQLAVMKESKSEQVKTNRSLETLIAITGEGNEILKALSANNTNKKAPIVKPPVQAGNQLFNNSNRHSVGGYGMIKR